MHGIFILILTFCKISVWTIFCFYGLLRLHIFRQLQRHHYWSNCDFRNACQAICWQVWIWHRSVTLLLVWLLYLTVGDFSIRYVYMKMIKYLMVKCNFLRVFGWLHIIACDNWLYLCWCNQHCLKSSGCSVGHQRRRSHVSRVLDQCFQEHWRHKNLGPCARVRLYCCPSSYEGKEIPMPQQF